LLSEMFSREVVVFCFSSISFVWCLHYTYDGWILSFFPFFFSFSTLVAVTLTRNNKENHVPLHYCRTLHDQDIGNVKRRKSSWSQIPHKWDENNNLLTQRKIKGVALKLLDSCFFCCIVRVTW
jgi:hypothetical protein